jgi:membrane protein required for colicin V production
MTRELLGLAGWVASVLVANFTSPMIETPIADFLQVKGLGVALAWALPFAASVVIWFILASLLAPGLKRVGFGSLDRWLGVLFGFTRGFGLVLIVFVAAVFAAEGEDNLPDIVKDSHSSPALSRSAYYFSGFVPKDYREKLIDNLTYRAPLATNSVSQGFDAPIKAGKDALDSGMNLFSDEKAN